MTTACVLASRFAAVRTASCLTRRSLQIWAPVLEEVVIAVSAVDTQPVAQAVVSKEPVHAPAGQVARMAALHFFDHGLVSLADAHRFPPVAEAQMLQMLQGLDFVLVQATPATVPDVNDVLPMELTLWAVRRVAFAFFNPVAAVVQART